MKKNEELVTIELDENVMNEVRSIAEKFNEIEETSIEIAIRISELVEGKERKMVGMIYDEFGKLLEVKRSTLSTLKKAGDRYRKSECLLDVPYTKVALIPDDMEVNETVSEILHNCSQREIKKELDGENEVEEEEIEDCETSKSNIKTYSTNNLLKTLKKIINTANACDYINDSIKICGKTLHIEGEVCYFE